VDEAEDRLSLPRPQWSHHEIAIWGGASEDDLTIANGYLEVAEIAARYWIAHGPNDFLPIPILYNYRHSIELTLKWLIRTAAGCAVQEGYRGPEDLSPAKLDERPRTHSIRKLADCLNRYPALLDLPKPEQRIDPESWKQLNWLDSEDATGEIFRYAVVGHGPHRAAARRPEKLFDALAARLPATPTGHIVLAPVVVEPAVVPERQLRRLQSQATEDRPVRLDGEDDLLVVHALVVAGAPGNEVFVQQPSQGHGHIQVRLGGQRTETQTLHQFDIEPPELTHPLAGPTLGPVHRVVGLDAEEFVCVHACASRYRQRCDCLRLH
jgi:hypothetical protein